MTEHSIVLLVCLAVIVVLAILIYVSSRSQTSDVARICDLRLTLNQIVAETQNIDQSLRQQRHILNDAHKKICAVTKGLQKPAK
jgi:sensor histidine kinase regulating citrate/malate metabolism